MRKRSFAVRVNIDAKRTALNRKKKRNEQSQLFIISCLVFDFWVSTYLAVSPPHRALVGTDIIHTHLCLTSAED